MSADIPLVDLGDCRDIFVCGIARIESLPGGCCRIFWYVDEADSDPRCGMRRVVVDRHVMPLSVALQLGETIACMQAERARRAQTAAAPAALQ
jgi:hypothetical protein